jgi:hypothetical protein
MFSDGHVDRAMVALGPALVVRKTRVDEYPERGAAHARQARAVTLPYAG